MLEALTVMGLLPSSCGAAVRNTCRSESAEPAACSPALLLMLLVTALVTPSVTLLLTSTTGPTAAVLTADRRWATAAVPGSDAGAGAGSWLVGNRECTKRAWL